MAQFFIKNLNSRVKKHPIGHLSKAPKRTIRWSEFPYNITLVDIETKEEVSAQILSYVSIEGIGMLPEVFALLSENQMPDDCVKDVLIRCNVKSIDELAFYTIRKT